MLLTLNLRYYAGFNCFHFSFYHGRPNAVAKHSATYILRGYKFRMNQINLNIILSSLPTNTYVNCSANTKKSIMYKYNVSFITTLNIKSYLNDTCIIYSVYTKVVNLTD